MRFGEGYGDYLARRWNELGGEAATAEVRRRLGIENEKQMLVLWEGTPEQKARAESYAFEFKAVQCPRFIQIIGELYHVHGHRDVGLGRKTGGNNWPTPQGPVACDIVVLKDLDGGPEVQLIDCMRSMGGPESKPRWDVIEANSDRTWQEPPVPAGVPSQPDPEPTPEPDPPPSDAVLEAIATLVGQVDALRAEVASLKARPFPSYGASLFGQRITFTPIKP